MARRTKGHEHRRSPKLIEIPVAEIKMDPGFQADAQFIRLLTQHAQGKIRTALTRLPENMITSGYFVRNQGRSVHVTNLRSENVPVLTHEIRRGLRPRLALYWSPFAPGISKYVCPDDEAALAAYRELGISLVPCEIFRPKQTPQSEAAVVIEKAGEVPGLFTSYPPSQEGIQMVFGTEDPPFDDLIAHFIAESGLAREKIKQFHIPGDSPVHYHQMLHAFVRRHERTLDTIRLLVSRNRTEHAAALLRMAYEAFLNFYLDWLSPSFFGPRFQLLGAVREAESHARTDEERRELAEGLQPMASFLQIMETTAQKARLSPLGEELHRIIYAPLSQVAHQSYTYLELEAQDFDDEAPNRPADVRQMGRWIDAISTALLVRIRNEIGAQSLDRE